MPDPGFPVHCPHCGETLVYDHSEGDTHFYRCPHHEVLVLLPDGRIRMLITDDEDRDKGAPS